MPNEIEMLGDEAAVIITRRTGERIVTRVDAADVPLISGFTWCISSHGYPYAFTRGGRKTRRPVSIHRIVTNAPLGSIVDHINHDPLDNRKANLRVVNKILNGRNRVRPGGNVSYYPNARKWYVRFTIKGKNRYFGGFPTKEEADKRADEIRPRFIAGDDFGY